MNDTKKLRGILDMVYLKGMQNGLKGLVDYQYSIQSKDIAIKEIQELCEPMSEEEIAKSIYEHCNVHGYNMMRIEHRQFLAKALVGKLSTPRLTDWEKVLESIRDECKRHSRCCVGESNALNKIIYITDSALKSMSEPRLMEECPEYCKCKRDYSKIDMSCYTLPPICLYCSKEINPIYLGTGKKTKCYGGYMGFDTGKKPSNECEHLFSLQGEYYVCKKCGDVIAQCRCIEGHNNIEYRVCEKCSRGA